MRDPARTVVVTGVGVLCHLGDDLSRIEAALRDGRGLPFVRHPPAVEAGSRCQLLGSDRGELTAERRQARFMGRAALMAYKATLMALAQSGLERRDIAVVAGSGTGDVATHIEVQRHLARPDRPRPSPTVIPRMMASTVSANLATALHTTGPSFSVSAACSGGADNTLLAAELIEQGHVDAALAGGVEVADDHFHAGFDAMRAFNGQDNEHPARASRPYARDRAGFIFGEGAGMVVLETKADAEARGAEVLGVLAGYGMSSDGTGDMVCPTADGGVAGSRRASTPSRSTRSWKTTRRWCGRRPDHCASPCPIRSASAAPTSRSSWRAPADRQVSSTGELIRDGAEGGGREEQAQVS